MKYSADTPRAAPDAKPEYADSFRSNNLFVGPNMRVPLREGRADFTPVFLSEVPSLFRKDILPLDHAFIQVWYITLRCTALYRTIML
jgi:acyl-CoA hydrolase